MRTLDLVWVGGAHPVRLDLGALRELQAKCDAGPFALLQRLTTGHARVDDAIEVLRLGLAGGGMGREEARKLVLHMVDLHGLRCVIQPAIIALGWSLSDPEPEAGGDDTAEKTPGVSPATEG